MRDRIGAGAGGCSHAGRSAPTISISVLCHDSSRRVTVTCDLVTVTQGTHTPTSGLCREVNVTNCSHYEYELVVSMLCCKDASFVFDIYKNVKIRAIKQ